MLVWCYSWSAILIVYYCKLIFCWCEIMHNCMAFHCKQYWHTVPLMCVLVLYCFVTLASLLDFHLWFFFDTYSLLPLTNQYMKILCMLHYNTPTHNLYLYTFTFLCRIRRKMWKVAMLKLLWYSLCNNEQTSGEVPMYLYLSTFKYTFDSTQVYYWFQLDLYLIKFQSTCT